MTDLTPTPEGGEVLLTPGSGGFDLSTVVAALDGGGYVVAWRARGLEDASSGGIYAQVFAANGTPAGSRILVNTTTAGSQFTPSITALADGGFAIAWVSQNPDVSTPKENIYMQRFDAAGAPQGGETLVNTLLDLTSQNQPAIAGLDGGGIVVTWKTADFFKSVDNSGGVLAQRFDENGMRLGGEHQVNTTIPTSQTDPSITALADGGYVITWTDSLSVINSGPLMDREDINGQRYTAEGVPVGGEFSINTGRVGQQIESAVTALEGGGFVVVWQTPEGSSFFTDVQFQIFDAAGMKVGGEVRVNTTVADVQEFPSVTGLADGGFVVSWTSHNQIPDDTRVAYDVYGQRFDAAGMAVGGEFLINENTLNKQYQGAQQIARGAQHGLDQLEDGSLVAVWIDAGGNLGSEGFAKVRQFSLPSDGPVNTAPAGADKTITFDEDAGHIFALADFGFTDPDAGDTLAAVTITSTGSSGAFFLNGDFIGTGTRILASEIAAGNLSFGTVPNANGDNYSGLTFQVEDQNGGLDASPNTIVFNITPISDAPAGADKTITIDEDTSHVFSLSDFGFTDLDEGDTFAAVTITSTTSSGAYFLNGDFIGTGTRVLASDIAAGMLAFSPLQDANGNNYASFTFQVEDQAGGVDASPNTVTFNVLPVDEPDPYNGVTINGSDGEKDTISPTRAPLGQPRPTALNDKLFGFGGDDALDGGIGGDLMTGGDGNDKYTIDNALDVVVEEAGATAGTKDLMQSSKVSFTLAANVENGTLTGTGELGITGNDLANQLTGNNGINSLYGFGGKDKLFGKGGNDNLYGGDESDLLNGETGNDGLFGEAGSDTINGGQGQDTLSGGLNADRFVFDKFALVDNSIDEITDFSGKLGEGDRIDLAAIDANGIGVGNGKFAFIGGGTFTGAGAEVRFFSLFGDTVVEADIDGNQLADLTIILTGGAALQLADFIL